MINGRCLFEKWLFVVMGNVAATAHERFRHAPAAAALAEDGLFNDVIGTQEPVWG